MYYTIASYFCEYSFSSPVIPVIHLYLYFHTFRNEFFKFFSLYKFFRAYVKHKRTSRFFQKTTYSVLSDITVFCCLFNCKSHFFTYRNILFVHKILYIPKKLRAQTIEWLEETNRSSGYLFLNRYGDRISTRGISQQLKNYADKYGLDKKVVYPHSFRHRYAKNFLEKYNDIALLADLMGHESIETTRIYLRRTASEQQELVDKIVTW